MKSGKLGKEGEFTKERTIETFTEYMYFWSYSEISS
jgi:hypothetical protein